MRILAPPSELTPTLWANVINAAISTVTVIHQALGPKSTILSSIDVNLTIIYLSISISLNVLLTLMIVIRLFLHSRGIRAATNAPGGIGGLYKATITMLIESCALFTVSSLLVVGPSNSGISYAFFPILAETQVRALLR